MAQPEVYDAQRLSHAYIFTAQDPEEGLREALRLAAAAVCTGPEPVPCGSCRACRKVREGIHPDVMRIGRRADDKGRKKREIAVDQIRQLARDAVVLPNEAKRKVYLIEEADKMNLAAQNAALKLLEEPPPGVIFILCAENAQALLPTVRSRCVEIHGNGQRGAPDEVGLRLAREYVETVAGGSPSALLLWCAGHEGMDNRAAVSFVDSGMTLLADMLCGREADPGLGQAGLRRLLALLERCAGYLQVNVGVKHIFGLLAVGAVESSGNRG